LAMPTKEKYGVVDDHGVLWKATSPGKFSSVPEEGLVTCWDTLAAGVKRNGDKRAVGWRPIKERTMEKQGDKSFEKLVLEPYQWITYNQYFGLVESLGAALVKRTGAQPGDRVVIFAETQKEWLMTAYACWRQSLTVVTIYATLGEEGVMHGIKQTRAKVVVTDSKLLKVLSNVADQCETLEHVVAITPPMVSPAASETAPPQLGVETITVHAMEDMLKEDAAAVAPSPPSADDHAVIMYTSGTTGVPKGVIIQHKQIVALVAGTIAEGAVLMNDVPPLGRDDVYLAYLPLAHIMELATEVTVTYLGTAIGYGTPHTLTPTGVKMKQTEPRQAGDAQALQPTVLVFAPAVLDKVYAGINAKVAAGSTLKQTLFKWALDSGISNYDQGHIGAWWVYDKLVFKNVQALLGGRVRFMLAGSAPLSPDVQKFVQSCFNAPLRQGYGLTETCAATCISSMADNDTSQVGPPQQSACIRLRDWEEGNYKNSDLDDPGIKMRRGEVLIGGPAVCAGYLVDEEDPDPEVVKKNEEEFVVLDGIRYFCTGDIGQITPKGQIQIIDRKKDLVKLQQGEYVALSKVENVLKNSKYTAIPMVYAKSTMSYCIVLLCPQEAALKQLAQELGLQGTDMKSLCTSPKINEVVLKDLQAACKAKKLAAFETPSKLVLIDEEWSVENDMLTSTQKVKRKPIADKHQAAIDQVYK